MAIHLKTIVFLSLNSTRQSLHILELHTEGFVKQALTAKHRLNNTYLLSCSVCVNNVSRHIQSLFLCINHQYVSTAFVFDGIGDCKDQETLSMSSDEASFIFLGRRFEHCFSSPFHYISKNKTCKSFIFSLEDRGGAKENFARKSSWWKPSNPDLQLQVPMFPCKMDATIFFSISDVCIYELDREQNIIPCTDGSHVQECSTFQCNAKFKCHNFYCISWGYVCDGQWDCPSGFDETSQHCSPGRACKQLFKCRESHRCVSLQDVCNDMSDCPKHDDELLCQLHKRTCLAGCQCLNLAINCENVTSVNGKLTDLPYVAFHIVFCELQNVELIHQFALVVNLTFNSITEVCLHEVKPNNVAKFDISNNGIVSLSKCCFSNMARVKLLSFKNNNISSVELETFTNILSPFVLDLANNSLCTYKNDIFKNVENKVVVNIVRNQIISFDTPIFSEVTVSLVLTDQHQICTLVSSDVMCNMAKHWYAQTKILQSSAIAKVYLLLSVFTFIVNIFLFFIALKTFLVQKLANHMPLSMIFTGLCATNAFGIAYMTMVWHRNQHLGDTYALSDTLWRESLRCVFAFCCFCVYSVSGPHIYILVALSRYSVTTSPLTSKFKSCKLVVKCVVIIDFISSLLAVGITCSVSLANIIPNAVCLPYIDPSKSLIQTYFFCSLLLIIHINALLCISVLSAKMAAAVRKSGIESGTFRTLPKKSIFQIVFVTLVCAVSWLSLTLVSVSLLFIEQYPVDIISWIPPIVLTDSVITPTVYLRSEVLKWNNCELTIMETAVNWAAVRYCLVVDALQDVAVDAGTALFEVRVLPERQNWGPPFLSKALKSGWNAWKPNFELPRPNHFKCRGMLCGRMGPRMNVHEPVGSPNSNFTRGSLKRHTVQFWGASPPNF